ncbi:hypothetical protein [Formosa haliotis]|uniref:hypothetical protein n=1 Tax=Formosa haliotis TaxID=1555194 RepID=UPI000825349B|nr:hypothetical protein [Formosa haliotis]
MKPLKLAYLFVFALLCITSCSSEDDSDTPTEITLTGKWTGVTSTYNGINFGEPEKNSIVFSADQTVKFTNFNYGNYTETTTLEAYFELNDDILIFDWQSEFKDLESLVLKINSLTEDTLEIQYNTTVDGIIVETYKR